VARESGLYEFGSYRLDLAKRLLTRAGESVALAPKTYELLLLLVQSKGRALSKQELMSALWPDTFVEKPIYPSRLMPCEKRSATKATTGSRRCRAMDIDLQLR